MTTTRLLARMRGPFWLGLGLTAFGATWLYEGLGLHTGGRYSGISAGTFVVVIGAVMTVLGLATAIAAFRGAEFKAEDAEDAAADGPVSLRGLGLTIAAMVVPIFAMETAGFPITIAAVFFIIAKAFGSERTRMDALVAVLTSAGIWFLLTGFGVNLGPAFPFLGPFLG